MKKVISFEKEIDFPSMIGEISSISIDSSLKFIDESSVDGSLKVFGTYKMTEASTLEENFSYDIPVDIELTEKVDYKDAKISINDFNYEIKNDDILKCNIDILIDAVEEITLEEENVVEVTESIEQLPKIDNVEEENEFEISDVEESSMESLTRECDGDKKEMKDQDAEEVSEDKKMKDANTKNISSLFEVLNDAEETFTTYSVYILRKEDTIESVMDKYKVTKEELSNYNDLSNIEIGSKIVIPQSINE